MEVLGCSVGRQIPVLLCITIASQIFDDGHLTSTHRDQPRTRAGPCVERVNVERVNGRLDRDRPHDCFDIWAIRISRMLSHLAVVAEGG